MDHHQRTTLIESSDAASLPQIFALYHHASDWGVSDRDIEVLIQGPDYVDEVDTYDNPSEDAALEMAQAAWKDLYEFVWRRVLANARFTDSKDQTWLLEQRTTNLYAITTDK